MTTVINQQLELIKRDGDNYFIRNAVTAVTETTYAYPVYTGNLTPGGTVSRSQTLKKLNTVAKVVASDDMQQITEAMAQKIMSQYGHDSFNIQRNSTGWVAWVK